MPERAQPEPFVGRTEILLHLDSLLDKREQHENASNILIVAVLAGAAGVGKTALAVRWAHRVRHHFSDGELYVNLRGYDPSGKPFDPGTVLADFLRALGIPPDGVPQTVEAKAALYRSLLHGRKVLIVLDNAFNAGQVRPLLPGSNTCFVVVTSRSLLSGLSVRDGACRVKLKHFSRDDSISLLREIIGPDRVDAEPRTVDSLVELCDRLPLALRIAGERAACSTATLADLVATLADRQYRLDILSTDEDDITSAVRAVLSWSYHALPKNVARMFRVLGLHPGADICPYAASALMGVTIGTAKRLLDYLAGVHLVEQKARGRFRLHDLVRIYAIELTAPEGSEFDRRNAMRRELNFYLDTATIADHWLAPSREMLQLNTSQSGVTHREIRDYQEALDWFSVEHNNLLATVRVAVEQGFDSQAWRLSWTLTTFLYRQGYWQELAEIHHRSLAASTRLNDRAAEAESHRILSSAYTRLGSYVDALIHAEQALELYLEIGDCAGEANVHLVVGLINERQGDFSKALTHTSWALGLFRSVANRAGTIRALNSLGWNLARTGSYEQALKHCIEVFGMLQELGDRHGEAHALDTIGYCYHHLGQYYKAVKYYTLAIDQYRNLGDWYNTAGTLGHLGDLHSGEGNEHAARRSWIQARAILEALKHPDLKKIKKKLNEYILE